MRLAPLTLLLLAPLLLLAAADQPPPDPRATFTDGSLWVGTSRAIHHPLHRHEARLRITKRDGDSFEADYHVQADDDKRSLSLKGQIDAKGNLRAQPFRLLGGDWHDDNLLNEVWTGSTDGHVLTLTRTAKSETYENVLTLQDQAKGKKKKRK